MKGLISMKKINKSIVAAIRKGELKMFNEGQSWSDDEKTNLLTEYFSGVDLTTMAYKHQRTESAIMQQLIINNAVKNSTKSRQPYHKKNECQCYRCKQRGTPNCNYCDQNGEKNNV